MVMFLALHPMESISLNSFVLLEHLHVQANAQAYRVQTSFWCSLNISFKIVSIGLQYSKGFWMDQDLTQFSDKILCDEVDTIIAIF